MGTPKDAAATVPEQPEAATGPAQAAPEAVPAAPSLPWSMPGDWSSTTPPAGETGLPEAMPGRLVLAAVEPLGSVTLPPLEEGGETTVITREGTEVDSATALRAYEATQGHGLRVIQPSE